ncbi:hypothetical protein Tco_1192290 [Tanacetum coccineum]
MVINSPCLTDKKELAIPGQTATGKEFSNPLMAGSLPKTISAKINYALTVSPTIYASYIEQFWNTATSKTVNSVKQIHAIVDGKAVVITESSMRNVILFDDEDGITCLTNDEIFENLALIGYEQLSTKLTFQKGKVTLLFESMLVQNQASEGESLVTPAEPQPTPSTSQPNVSEPQTELLQIELLQTETPPPVSYETQTEANIEQILPSPSIYQRKHRKTQKHRRAKNVTELPQTSVPLDLRADEAVHKEGMTVEVPGAKKSWGVLLLRLGLRECLNSPMNEPPLSEGHTSRSREGMMEHTFKLIDIVSPTPHDSPLPGGSTPGSDEGRLKLEELMVESFDDDLDEEDASKQGRTSDKTKPMFKDSNFDDLDDLMDEGMAFVQEKDAENQGKIGVDDTEAVNTAGEGVSTAAPRTPPTTTIVFDDEDVTMAMAQTLIKMKEEKDKEKGVAIKDVKDSSRPIRSITTLQPLPTIDPKDKGKCILQETEPMEKIKKKVQGDAQIERDAEISLRLQAELDEELRVKRERQEEASKVAIADMFDEVQARIDADYELAARMTHEEQENYTIKERARLLAEFFERRKKQLATERGLYEKQQKRIQDFTPIDLEKEAQKPAKRLKRVAGSYATQKSPKKPKVMKSVKDVIEEEAAEYEKEKEELRLSLKIISNDDSEVNYEPLSKKFPIVNWEYQLLGKMEEKDMYVYKLTRADGSSSYHGDTQAFLRRLDRQDLNDLYRLVQERFQDHPLEGHDLLLWGDLRMIFDPDEKDKRWINQLDWKLLRWKLYENCGVHTLFMDGKPMEINMLVEKKYHLIKELLEKMLNLQLEAEEESTIAFELIKFIKSLLEE